MTAEWIEVGTTDELARQRKKVVPFPRGDIVVFWHDDAPHALANICIHRDRELAKGNIFGDRVICPGHQWAFDLDTGWCKEREQHQPVYRVRVDDGVVSVDASAPIEPDI